MRARCFTAARWTFALALLLSCSSQTFAADSGGRVISYFRRSPQQWQWRVFDPLTRRDTLYLSVRERPSLVRWDSSFTQVTFQVQQDIFQANWRLGVKARRVAQLPPFKICDWWQNSDSLSWALYTSQALKPPYPGHMESACRMEVWVCRDGRAWKMAHAETLECMENDCEGPPHSPWSKPIAMYSLEGAGTAPEWEELEYHDDSTGVGINRYYVPSRSDTLHGAEIGYFMDTETEGFNPPLYLVDRSTGTRQLLCGPEGDPGPNLYYINAVIAGDFLATDCDPSGRWRLFELSTGRRIAENLEWDGPVVAPALRK